MIVEPKFSSAELQIIRECLIDRIDRGSSNPYFMERIIGVFKKVDELQSKMM